MNKTIQIQHYHSPCGDLILGSYGNELCLCNWVIEKHQGRVDKRLQSLLNADYATHASDITQEAARQLDEYFGRKRTVFDIPLLFADTLWTDAFLRRDGSTARIAECCPCGGECEWGKCNIYLCSLSSGYRE